MLALHRGELFCSRLSPAGLQPGGYFVDGRLAFGPIHKGKQVAVAGGEFVLKVGKHLASDCFFEYRQNCPNGCPSVFSVSVRASLDAVQKCLRV